MVLLLKMRICSSLGQPMIPPDRDPWPHIALAFVFKGPPGTGKTTVARKVGQIFYDTGFLAAPQFMECSVTDLVSRYVGGTGQKRSGCLSAHWVRPCSSTRPIVGRDAHSRCYWGDYTLHNTRTLRSQAYHHPSWLYGRL